FDTASLHNQVESAVVAFSASGTNSRSVAVADDDAAMRQFVTGDSSVHATGTAASNDSAQTFTVPNPPTLPWGDASNLNKFGDDGNVSLAWDSANSTVYLATVSGLDRINGTSAASGIQVFAST